MLKSFASVFPTREFFNRSTSFLVTTVSNAADFFLGGSTPSFISLFLSFALILAY
jgi:hypothetical protein